MRAPYAYYPREADTKNIEAFTDDMFVRLVLAGAFDGTGKVTENGIEAQPVEQR